MLSCFLLLCFGEACISDCGDTILYWTVYPYAFSVELFVGVFWTSDEIGGIVRGRDRGEPWQLAGWCRSRTVVREEWLKVVC